MRIAAAAPSRKKQWPVPQRRIYSSASVPELHRLPLFSPRGATGNPRYKNKKTDIFRIRPSLLPKKKKANTGSVSASVSIGKVQEKCRSAPLLHLAFFIRAAPEYRG